LLNLNKAKNAVALIPCFWNNYFPYWFWLFFSTPWK